MSLELLRKPQEPVVQLDGQALSAYLARVQAFIKKVNTEAWVIAELASVSSGRHTYLDLVEHDDAGREVAKCRANLWGGRAQKVLNRFRLETGVPLTKGIKVMLFVESSFHVQYGYSLDVIDINPAFTLGDMERKLRDIREKLNAEGVLGCNRQLEQPTEFTRVAVISPAGAAGLGDFKSLADRLQALGLCTFHYFVALFQGTNAPQEIAAQIEAVERAHSTKAFDCMAIIRGGGAVTDLAFLNDLVLARAVCTASLPVFTGIGHERDHVILDEVARVSFHTPSKVIAHICETIIGNAQRAGQDWRAVNTQAHHLVTRARAETTATFDAIATQVKHAVATAVGQTNAHFQMVTTRARETCAVAQTNLDRYLAATSHAAQNTLRTGRRQCDASLDTVASQGRTMVVLAKREARNVVEAIRVGSKAAVDVARRTVEQAMREVLGLGPKKTLERGFAIVRDAKGGGVPRAQIAATKKGLEIEFADGKLKVNVRGNRV